MNPLRLVFAGLRQHAGSSALAAAAVALAVALMLAVTALREEAQRQFTQTGQGVDAVLGPKGSPLQIVLNALHHLEEMPGRIPWTIYQEVRADPVVADGFAFISGHSYAGFRVNAVEARFLSDFRYRAEQHFTFAAGRAFARRGEAVAGAEAARALGLELGRSFDPVCGMKEGDPVHADDRITFVGVLAPTGTAHDRAIYIPLEAFYTLEGHGSEVAAMADDLAKREISGAYLRLARIRAGAFHPGVQILRHALGQEPRAQLVLPAEVMPRLFAIIGWVDALLLAVGALVAVLAGAFLAFALVATLRERQRDLALLRALGAGRRTIFGLVLAQAQAIGLVGALAGWILGRALIWLGCQAIAAETGLRLDPWRWSVADTWLLPTACALAVLAGLWPAIQTYRIALHDALKPSA